MEFTFGDCALIIVLCVIILYQLYWKSGLVSKPEKAEIIEKTIAGVKQFPHFTEWRAKIPETDAVEFMDVKKLFSQTPMPSKQEIERVL